MQQDDFRRNIADFENSQLPSDHATPPANQWRSKKIMDLFRKFSGDQVDKTMDVWCLPKWMAKNSGWFFWALKRKLPRSSEVFSLLEMMFGQVPPGDLPVAPPQEIVLKPGRPGRVGWGGPMAWYKYTLYLLNGLWNCDPERLVARWIWPYHWLITIQIYHPHPSNRSFWISASSSSYRNVP